MNSLPEILQRVPGRLLNRELHRRKSTKLDPHLRKQFLAICNDVAKRYNVDAKAMRSPSRQEIYTWPRYVVMKVLNSLGWTLQSIADGFGYECHSTISHGLRSHSIRTRTDQTMHQHTQELVAKYGSTPTEQPSIIATISKHLGMP